MEAVLGRALVESPRWPSAVKNSGGRTGSLEARNSRFARTAAASSSASRENRRIVTPRVPRREPAGSERGSSAIERPLMRTKSRSRDPSPAGPRRGSSGCANRSVVHLRELSSASSCHAAANPDPRSPRRAPSRSPSRRSCCSTAASIARSLRIQAVGPPSAAPPIRVGRKFRSRCRSGSRAPGSTQIRLERSRSRRSASRPPRPGMISRTSWDPREGTVGPMRRSRDRSRRELDPSSRRDAWRSRRSASTPTRR